MRLLRQAGCTSHDRTALQLIEAFGSLGAAVGASQARQLRACGDTKAVRALRRFRETMRLVLSSEMERKDLSNCAAAKDFLRAEMAYLVHEQFRVLHLNIRHRLISVDVLADGTLDHCPIPIRELIRHALETGAAGLVLAHNHPSGDHTPSRADIDLTRRIANAGHLLGIVVHDHIVISSQGESSMRELNLI
jgi:DNA repair protein RadC